MNFLGFRIAKEGALPIGVAVGLCLCFFLSGFLLVAFFLGLIAVCLLAFFRDPERLPPVGEMTVAAPADGKVLTVEIATEPEFLKMPCVKLSIFMSVLDVHMNYVPVDGEVTQMCHLPGRFFDVREVPLSDENERNVVEIKTSGGVRVVVAQVAGLVARRIRCYIGVGEYVNRGQRMGIIQFGSRVDLYLPEGTDVLVRQGDRVRGGETAVARLKG